MNSGFAAFTERDHTTWKKLFDLQTPLRRKQIIPEFSQGLELLNITNEKIPDLDSVNKKLNVLTGWQGVLVKGFEAPATFYEMLSKKQFPIGSFIRQPDDLSYTPEPDIFHDLYGHLPYFTIPAYAKFCQQFGTRALKYIHSETITREFQRFFWFTIEFALLKNQGGHSIFGAGITSSFNECAYALSSKPKISPFNIETIRAREFRIDILQEALFELENVEQLYSCLDEFEKPYLKQISETNPQ